VRLDLELKNLNKLREVFDNNENLEGNGLVYHLSWNCWSRYSREPKKAYKTMSKMNGVNFNFWG